MIKSIMAPPTPPREVQLEDDEVPSPQQEGDQLGFWEESFAQGRAVPPQGDGEPQPCGEPDPKDDDMDGHEPFEDDIYGCLLYTSDAADE